MKTNRLLIITGMVLFIGSGSAWIWKSLPSTDSGAGAAADSGASPGELRKRPSALAETRDSARYSRLLPSMRENRFKKEKLATDLDGLSPSEILGLLEVLAGRGGLGGLSNEDETVLEKILGWWVLKDQDAAVGWVLALRSKEDRNKLLGDMLETISSANPDDALALLEDLSCRHSETPSIPVYLMDKTAERGVDTLLRLCKAGVHETNTTVGHDLEYSSDFDFMAALNQLAELQASATRGGAFILCHRISPRNGRNVIPRRRSTG